MFDAAGQAKLDLTASTSHASEAEMKAHFFEGTALREYGDPSAPSLVLVHGLGLNQSAWQWQVPALAEKHRLITYDLYGHGDSISPPTSPSLSLFSEQLLGLMDYCKLNKTSLVGFSLGGMIVRKFAQQHANRVDNLVILHSPHQRTDAAQKAILKRVEQARTDGPTATVEAALERWFTAPFQADNPQIMDLVRDWVTSNNIDVYHKIYRVLADGIEEIVAPKPPITHPTLVITGNEDYGNGPEMTQAIAAEIPNAKSLILTGLRHMALAEDPEAVNRPILEFLNSTGA